MQDTMSPVCVSAPACVVNIVKLSSLVSVLGGLFGQGDSDL